MAVPAAAVVLPAAMAAAVAQQVHRRQQQQLQRLALPCGASGGRVALPAKARQALLLLWMQKAAVVRQIRGLLMVQAAAVTWRSLPSDLAGVLLQVLGALLQTAAVAAQEPPVAVC